MDITILTPGASGGYGGISKYNSNLINFFLKKKEIEKIFLFSRTKTNYKNKKILYVNEENILIFFFRILFNQFKILKSDLIFVTHVNLILFCLLPILMKKKVILCTYGLEIWGNKKNFVYQWLIKKIDHFICMRNYTKKKLSLNYELKNKNFYNLHNSIKFRNINFKNNASKNLITIARLDSSEKFKGIDETLDALSKLKKMNFLYNIVGEGNDKNRLIWKAKKLKNSNKIKFLGRINEKKKDLLLSKSHIMIMPGSDKTFDTYPFRFIFLEAAEYGLHIIGSLPPIKEEIDSAKIYKSINFVNPRNTDHILKLIKKLQRKDKIRDIKLIKNFSLNNFEINLGKIINKIIK